MWTVGLGVVALFIVYVTHWIYKWKHPKCNGVLPPGSMGLPIIGETLQFFSKGHSLDIPPFVKQRMEKYGLLFKTSLVGRPVVVSADPEFNQFIFQQEGKLVELWYLDSFTKLLGQDGSDAAKGHIHKYLRNVILNHFGVETLKEKILPELEKMARQSLHIWSKQESVEVKRASSEMIFGVTSKLMFSYDSSKSKNLSDVFNNFIEGMMSFPLNIPGTTFHKCLKNQKKVLEMMKEILEERFALPETRHGDFLDRVIADMKNETFLSKDFIVYMMLGLQFASSDTISATLTVAIRLLTDHPSIVKQLTEEHEAILRNKKNVDAKLTWDDYKMMLFTLQVINETLRLANVAPGILRKSIKEFKINGYTIPADWTIMVVPSAIQLNPDKYENPLDFNPQRWKGLESSVISKSFIPFGGGTRACAGAEFSRVLMAMFIHFLVTKYRWTTVKGGEIVRTPVLGFGNGFHIKVSEK